MYKRQHFGFGCWNAYGDEMKQAVMTALSCGYRYIDSAARYQNEEDVGRGIAESDTPRDQVYLLSKLWPLDFETPVEALDQTPISYTHLDVYKRQQFVINQTVFILLN